MNKYEQYLMDKKNSEPVVPAREHQRPDPVLLREYLRVRYDRVVAQMSFPDLNTSAPLRGLSDWLTPR